MIDSRSSISCDIDVYFRYILLSIAASLKLCPDHDLFQDKSPLISKKINAQQAYSQLTDTTKLILRACFLRRHI